MGSTTIVAVYSTIRHFRHNLEGRYFFVNTDHKPLTFVMSSVTERPSLRQTRQLAFIAKFTTDIRYVKGERNFVADALSRPTVSFLDNTSTINYKDLSTDQALATEFTRLRHSKSSTMNFKLLKSFDNNLIWCDVSTGHIRPNVTAKFRKQVFLYLHGLGHPSHRATKPLINTRFVWHGMNIDIAVLAKVVRPLKYLAIISQFSANSTNPQRDLTTYIYRVLTSLKCQRIGRSASREKRNRRGVRGPPKPPEIFWIPAALRCILKHFSTL